MRGADWAGTVASRAGGYRTAREGEAELPMHGALDHRPRRTLDAHAGSAFDPITAEGKGFIEASRIDARLALRNQERGQAHALQQNLEETLRPPDLIELNHVSHAPQPRVRRRELQKIAHGCAPLPVEVGGAGPAGGVRLPIPGSL